MDRNLDQHDAARSDGRHRLFFFRAVANKERPEDGTESCAWLDENATVNKAHNKTLQKNLDFVFRTFRVNK